MNVFDTYYQIRANESNINRVRTKGVHTGFASTQFGGVVKVFSLDDELHIIYDNILYSNNFCLFNFFVTIEEI